MTRIGKTHAVVAAVGAVAVLALILIIGSRLSRAESHTVNVTITRIDADARTASVELVRPKTGQTIQLEGTVPPECEISIDGQPAALGDLRVGDRAQVRGRVHSDRTLSADWVRVTRAATATSPAP